MVFYLVSLFFYNFHTDTIQIWFDCREP